VDDHIIGFLAQQTVEKSLKVALDRTAALAAAASASGWAASLLADAKPAQPDPGRESQEESSPELEA
jgi:ribosomal protein L12E/L44/L45/RPP1/RPP2